MRIVDTLLVVAVLALVGYLGYLLVRWYLRTERPPAVSGPRSTPWAAGYQVEADLTVWSIHRTVHDAGGRPRRRCTRSCGSTRARPISTSSSGTASAVRTIAPSC